MRIAVAGNREEKATIVTSLAMALLSSSQEGDTLPRHVALADCDINSTRCAALLHPRIRRTTPVEMMIPIIDQAQCTLCGQCVQTCQFHALAIVRDQVLFFENLCLGCDNCHLTCPDQAIRRGSRQIGQIERGRVGSMAFVQGTLSQSETPPERVIQAIRRQIGPRREQAVIVNTPAGASSLLFEALRESDYCLMVTGPTRYDLHNLQRTVALSQDTLAIPLGVILCCTDSGQNPVESYCSDQDIPIVMRIPSCSPIRAARDQSVPPVVANPEFGKAFMAIYRRISNGALSEEDAS